MNSLLYAIVGLLGLVLFLYALVKILGSSMGPMGKVLWIILCLVCPVVGPVLYLLVGGKCCCKSEYDKRRL